jgi:lipoprotein-releasing system ATP-binding protein
MNDVIITARSLQKSYQDARGLVRVLDAIDFSIYQGDRIAIVGPSGSGKSTLLHLLGGLDQPTSGQVLAHGQDWQQLTEKQRCALRNQAFGFVYQFHHLLPEFTALENVAMPLVIGKLSIKDAYARAEHILNEVGLRSRLDHKPAQLSGGERQRVAIARALVHRPQCVFADEPTGNLDQTTANQVFELMLKLNQTLKTALVIVTHDQRLAQQMDIIMTLKEGTLTQELIE